MQFFADVWLITLVGIPMAYAERKVIVSYSSDAPEGLLDQAKKTIEIAGGVITHEYHLIKAFAAKASDEALGAVNQALVTVESSGIEYHAIVEEDTQVHANVF